VKHDPSSWRVESVQGCCRLLQLCDDIVFCRVALLRRIARSIPASLDGAAIFFASREIVVKFVCRDVAKSASHSQVSRYYFAENILV
jgi:hypothetical protein